MRTIAANSSRGFKLHVLNVLVLVRARVYLFKVFAAVRLKYPLLRDLHVIMIDTLYYCRSTDVLLAMHVWLYVVGVLYTWSQLMPVTQTTSTHTIAHTSIYVLLVLS